MRKRKTSQVKTLTINDRGATLCAVVREMPVAWREAWIMKAVKLIATAGASVPFGTDFNAMVRHFREGGLAAFGNVDYAEAKALLDELLECVSVIDGDGSEIPLTLETADERIRSVNTLLQLRLEALMLNIDRAPDGSLAVPVDAGAVQDAGVPIQ